MSASPGSARWPKARAATASRRPIRRCRAPGRTRDPCSASRSTGCAAPGAPEAPPPARPCDAGCGTGFDPFAWLARLFGAGDADRAPQTPAPAADAAAETPVAESPAPGAVRVPESAADTTAVAPEPPADTAVLPVSPAPAGDLRTGEAIGRIWIAPFVDANGVYREAAHVRVVLEPAGWRLK